ncbi:MAG TPA: 30S ribosomal protein S12 methylthiotransferase RimO, partial [Thermodesulfovibrionia bacterium]|nr:30S ribosomal protein S12 methylthiotransferase RimO [Thermodesulfovibrionia bacterium]
LAQRLKSNGFTDTESENADMLIINTCCFIEDAKKESIEAIFEAVSTGKPVIVTGCLSKRYYKDLIREIPEVRCFFGTGQSEEVVNACISVSGKPPIPVVEMCKSHVRKRMNPSHYAYLKIAEGCSRACTYCVIPFIRGAYRSVDPETILQEAQALVQDGVRELIVVAQETTYYGKDLNIDNGLSRLLHELASIEGLSWIRVLYAHPSSINDVLLKTMAETSKVLPYIDVPLQHSDSRILKAMNRKGSASEYLELIQRIRKYMPDAVIRTTMIVGFPGEGERHFQGLLDFVQEAEFDRLGAFSYSCEEGTKAARLPGHVPESVAMQRLEQLMALQSDISLKKNRHMTGTVHEAIIDQIQEVNGFSVTGIGRIWGQTPEVDGLTFVKACSGQLTAGQIVEVKLIDASEYDLEGVLMNTPKRLLSEESHSGCRMS